MPTLDLDDDIARLEDKVERLAEIAERCRKLILGAKVAIGSGGLMLAAILLGVVPADPALLVSALATVIGGIVTLGSNTSTRRQTLAATATAEARRAALIDGFDLHVVAPND